MMLSLNSKHITKQQTLGGRPCPSMESVSYNDDANGEAKIAS